MTSGGPARIRVPAARWRAGRLASGRVALELFAEQGYEKTSLREIAERLGVTKAALYYHFKSKEDIVHSFTDDYFAEIDALLDWAKDQPRSDDFRLAILDRYVGIVIGGSEVFRFLEQNRASMQAMETGKDRFVRFRDRLDTLVDLLTGPGAQMRDRVRASAAVLTVGAACHIYLQQVDDPDKLRAIILEMATDLIG